MAPKLRDSGDPGEWLRHARSNLSRCRADRRLPDVLFEDLCFDAQQAAEKALKTVLISRGRRFPKTHDLAELLHLVAAMGLDLPPEVLEAKRLTPYAVAGRYPGVSEDASLQDYEEALKMITQMSPSSTLRSLAILRAISSLPRTVLFRWMRGKTADPMPVTREYSAPL